MSCNTHLFNATIEVWKKKDIVTRSQSGQVQAEWELEETITCDFMPARAEERLVGRIQNPIAYNVFIGGDHLETVTVEKQLRNLKDGSGSIIEEGPFNIIGVRKYMGFSHIDHLTVSAQKVLE